MSHEPSSYSNDGQYAITTSATAPPNSVYDVDRYYEPDQLRGVASFTAPTTNPDVVSLLTEDGGLSPLPPSEYEAAAAGFPGTIWSSPQELFPSPDDVDHNAFSNSLYDYEIPLLTSAWDPSRLSPRATVYRIAPHHVNTISGTHLHKCTVCSQTFSTLQDLEQHAKTKYHRLYVCGIKGCSKSYYRRDVYVRHKNTHRRANDHGCPLCSKPGERKTFSRRDHLTQHIRNCHSDQAYPESCGGRSAALDIV
ncbi:hypothetical protein LTR86_009695 [Recurvomyces mirabilis]|nr:hypothetical protein LTR86_009695 [Recurvomyces mirabilis]